MKWHFDMPPVDGTLILAKIRTHYYNEVESPPFFCVVYAKARETFDKRKEILFTEYAKRNAECWHPNEIIGWISFDELELEYEKQKEVDVTDTPF